MAQAVSQRFRHGFKTGEMALRGDKGVSGAQDKEDHGQLRLGRTPRFQTPIGSANTALRQDAEGLWGGSRATKQHPKTLAVL